jgi:N-acyl-D-amino-acid deacylase
MKALYLIFVTVIIWSCQPKSRQFDLIIRNAMIYDGSGNTPYAGDLAVSGDTIAAMGDLSRDLGNVEFDAKDLSVAPGFINMLSWANETLIEDGRSQSDLRQGVTLEVLGEGSSMGPWSNQMIEEEESAQGNIKYDVEWQTLGGYMEYMESRGVATNLASFVGNATLRRYVMGYDQRTATSEEMEKMTNLLDREMAMGAMGISSSLLYAPSRYANTAELIALSKTAAKHGVCIFPISGMKGSTCWNPSKSSSR